GRPLIRTEGVVGETTSRDASPLHVVVTGASSGIGAALTAALAEDGHQVFACARREDRFEEMRRRFPSLMTAPCDVSVEPQVKQFVASVAAATPRIDVLINCAGTLGEIGPVAETNSEAWWRTLEVNLFGTYLVIKHCLPLLQRGHRPRIINF